MKPSLTTPASSARWPNETYASVEVFIVYGVGLSQLQQPETSGRGTSTPKVEPIKRPTWKTSDFKGLWGVEGVKVVGFEGFVAAPGFWGFVIRTLYVASAPVRLSFFRQGYGEVSLSPSPGREGWSKPPGSMPTRCFIGSRGVKNERRPLPG